jgi:hypothetical protein
MQIFNVSPHRSGTQSFNAFCWDHSIASAHWPGDDVDAAAESALQTLDTGALWRLASPHYDGAGVASDLPVPLIYREAWANCPGARFLLVRRNPRRWVASVRRHTAGRDLSYLEKFFYWGLSGQRHDSLSGYSDDDLLRIYECYCQEVTTFLRCRGATFLTLKLEDAAIGNQLAAFIGFEATQPFGHVAT